MLVFTQAGVTSILADAAAAGKILDGALVHLYQNNYNPTPFDVIADYTEATYTGYASQAVASAAWNPVVQADGSAGLIGPGLFFNPTGTAITNVVYGYYVTDSTGATVLWGERFAAPVGMTGPGSGFTMVPQLNGVSQSS